MQHCLEFGYWGHGIYSAVRLLCGQFSHKYSQKTPHSSPVRTRYLVSFLWVYILPQFMHYHTILDALYRHSTLLRSSFESMNITNSLDKIVLKFPILSFLSGISIPSPGETKTLSSYSRPMSWMLMTWWRKEPGHQQSWYWLVWTTQGLITFFKTQMPRIVLG